ncbi:MAG: TolC family outer membrane protein [Caulobacteraceae bacterium]
MSRYPRAGWRTAMGAAALVGAGAALLGAPAARGETLGDAIALAYQSNPTLQAQRASQRALDETYVQAEAGYRPSANLQATLGYTSNDLSQFQNVVPSQQFPGQTETSGAVVTLTQPIYTGGRVSSQVSAAQASVLAGREALRQSEQDVLRNVIQAYVDVRRDQENQAIAQENVGLLKRQLDEAQARFEVGEITRTDVAQTQASVAAAQAQLSAAQAQLADSRASYAAVVGRNPGSLAPEPSLAKLLPASVEKAFDAAEHDNPQIRQADYTEQASAARVAAAKAQTRPTLAFQATLGYSGGSFGPASPFANYSHDVSATAVANFPLFTGGMTSSQIRQAAENNNIDRIGIEGTRRQVLLLVSQAWNQLLGARASLAANEVQVRAANIAFEGTRQEAQVGLRTTLDVLITEQNLSNAQLALVNARHDEYVAAAVLLAATGALIAENLVTGTPIYDPRANFDKVTPAYCWAPWTPALAAIDRLVAPAIVERPAPVAVPGDR